MVVAIRGTQSIADLVTDAVVHPEPMESWVPQVGVLCFSSSSETALHACIHPWPVQGPSDCHVHDIQGAVPPPPLLSLSRCAPELHAGGGCFIACHAVAHEPVLGESKTSCLLHCTRACMHACINFSFPHAFNRSACWCKLGCCCCMLVPCSIMLV